MALSDIALCSRALIRIGAAPITSFSDGTAEAEIASNLYGPARDAILSAYGWSFATAQANLSISGTAPIADYKNAFTLPAGFLRAMAAGNGGRGRGLEFRIMRNALHCDADAVTLTYIYRALEADCPPYFDAALITRLAAEFAIPITESTTRAEALYRLAEQEFQRARQIDAQQDTPQKLESFSLTDVR